MKKLFTFLLILIIAAALGIIAYQDNGYVLIGRSNTTIEMSLAIFIFLQILFYLLIALTISIVKGTWRLPDTIKQYHNRSKTHKARKKSEQGLIALAQGQWKKAEKALIKNVDYSDTPLLNYLSAARAAQKLNEPERRDHYLSMAHHSMPDADFAVELTQAELQLAHGQLEQSLATLVHLKSISPKHSHVLHFLAKIYEKLNSWKELQALLPELKKYKIENQQEIYRLQKVVYKNLLNSAALNFDNASHLISTWQALPSELKHDTDLILDYANKLILSNQHVSAESLLRAAIKHHWHAQFIYLYGLVKTAHPQQQLDFAESQVKQHKQNPVLLLSLGRLCLNLKLWGKAQAYFEASIGIAPMSETYKDLGQLLEQLGDNETASDHYRNGLQLAASEFSYRNLPASSDLALNHK
ncbi:hypothetical protein JYT31_01345 [Beggiatoa alba]|nr:hypothetical protein [Beggiatoa alba]